MFEDLSLLELLSKGGVTVIVLAIFSLISVAIMLERAWAFRVFRRDLSDFFHILKRTLHDTGVDAAVGACSTGASPLARVFMAGFRKKEKGKDEVNGAMELAGRAEIARLERFLGVLGTIGSTAPFIGLFGTVLGIIRAFSDLAIATGATPAAVADGIAEALVATAAGLFVAVPAVIGYNLFVRSVSRHALSLETMATEFIDQILSSVPEDSVGKAVKE
jgi:biopolymer transport protein ExbB